MAQRGASLQLNSAKNSSLPASSVVEWHQAEEEPAWQKLSPNSQRPPFLSPLTSTLTYPWFVTSRRYIEKCIFRNNFFCMTFIYLEAGKWKLGRKQKRRKSAKWELLLVLESKESAFSCCRLELEYREQYFQKTSHFARSGRNCHKILNIFVFHIVSHIDFAY